MKNENLIDIRNMAKESRRFEFPLVEIHVLKSFGPSALNRDFNNRQKSVTIGGTPRMLISSQCLKHAWLKNIKHDVINHDCTRTRKMPGIIVDEMLAEGLQIINSDEVKLAAEWLVTAVLSDDAPKSGHEYKMTANGKHYITKKVSFYDDEDKADIKKAVMSVLSEHPELIEQTLSLLKADKEETSNKKEDIAEKYPDLYSAITDIRKSMKMSCMTRKIGVLLATFGRMETNGLLRHIDSSLYCTMAFSTDVFRREVDNFITSDDMDDADDLLDFGDAGAGMMDTQCMNSNTMYYYCAVDMESIYKNMHLGNPDIDEEECLQDIRTLMAALVNAVLNIAPESKQHPMASSPAPLAAYITLKQNKAHVMTMEDAFETVVRHTSDSSSGTESVKRMVEKINQINSSTSAFTYKRPDHQFWLSNMYVDEDNGTAPKAVPITSDAAVIDEIVKLNFE